ncbi:MAG: hypothetical protein AAB074_20580 [Planctomycetota bacterium]
MESRSGSDRPVGREKVKLRPAWILLPVLLGCDRGPGKDAPQLAPPSDAQAVAEVWKRWVACAAAGDGQGAWDCLSRKTREERASLHRADTARIQGLSGPSLEAEARMWGASSDALKAAGPAELAILALTREFGRPEAEGRFRLEGASVSIESDVARVTWTGGARPAALVREEGLWKLDDATSRALPGR